MDAKLTSIFVSLLDSISPVFGFFVSFCLAMHSRGWAMQMAFITPINLVVELQTINKYKTIDERIVDKTHDWTYWSLYVVCVRDWWSTRIRSTIRYSKQQNENRRVEKHVNMFLSLTLSNRLAHSNGSVCVWVSYAKRKSFAGHWRKKINNGPYTTCFVCFIWRINQQNIHGIAYKLRQIVDCGNFISKNRLVYFFSAPLLLISNNTETFIFIFQKRKHFYDS